MTPSRSSCLQPPLSPSVSKAEALRARLPWVSHGSPVGPAPALCVSTFLVSGDQEMTSLDGLLTRGIFPFLPYPQSLPMYWCWSYIVFILQHSAVIMVCVRSCSWSRSLALSPFESFWIRTTCAIFIQQLPFKQCTRPMLSSWASVHGPSSKWRLGKHPSGRQCASAERIGGGSVVLLEALV